MRFLTALPKTYEGEVVLDVIHRIQATEARLVVYLSTATGIS